MSLVRERDSPLWLAVCDLRTQGVAANLTWVLPKNARGRTSLHSVYEGVTLTARLTYQFTLASHEGQRLTCVHRFGDGHAEQRTLYVPRYCEYDTNTTAQFHMSALSLQTDFQTSPPCVS